MLSWPSFFYDNPVWLWSTTFIVVTLAIVYLVMFIAHKYIKPSHEFLADNVISVGLLQVIATAYAVLLAFIVFNVLGVFQEAAHVSETEASYISNIFRGVNTLPRELAQPIQDNLRRYVHQVIEIEWPAQKISTLSNVKAKGWILLDNVGTVLGSSALGTVNSSIQAEMLSQLDQLYTERRMRILAASEALPNLIWEIVAFGSLALLSFFAVLGSENFRLKIFLATLVSICLSLLIILVIALDRPFRGELSVDATPYINILYNWTLITPQPDERYICLKGGC